jgi:hypothetical protein
MLLFSQPAMAGLFTTSCANAKASLGMLVSIAVCAIQGKGIAPKDRIAKIGFCINSGRRSPPCIFALELI